jgi:hypothetical protein
MSIHQELVGKVAGDVAPEYRLLQHAQGLVTIMQNIFLKTAAACLECIQGPGFDLQDH